MAKTKKIRGLKFAEGVDTSGIDWDSPADPDFIAELSKPTKIRVTTMLDVEVYDALKRRAGKMKGVKYQSLMNALLKKALFGTSAKRIRVGGEPDSELVFITKDQLDDITKRLEKVERAQPKKKA